MNDLRRRVHMFCSQSKRLYRFKLTIKMLLLCKTNNETSFETGKRKYFRIKWKIEKTFYFSNKFSAPLTKRIYGRDEKCSRASTGSTADDCIFLLVNVDSRTLLLVSVNHCNFLLVAADQLHFSPGRFFNWMASMVDMDDQCKVSDMNTLVAS